MTGAYFSLNKYVAKGAVHLGVVNQPLQLLLVVHLVVLQDPLAREQRIEIFSMSKRATFRTRALGGHLFGFVDIVGVLWTVCKSGRAYSG
jgi:hypothetical protein